MGVHPQGKAMRVVTRTRTAAAAVCAAVVVAVTGAGSAETLVERGAYLVTTIAACGNCHTPRDASGKPMTNMTLAGGFEFDDGPIGHVVVSNITPDPETGIGKWAFNANTNPNVNSPHYLQASLAINGQGANQNSILLVSTGSFFTSSATGTVVGSGPVRGSYFAPGASGPLRTASAASTVPDGLNNNLFGSNRITGFVLDQNSYSATDNPVQQLAASTPLGGSTTNYAFNQPAVASSVPSTIAGSVGRPRRCRGRLVGPCILISLAGAWAPLMR
jgi:hypothetical protein